MQDMDTNSSSPHPPRVWDPARPSPQTQPGEKRKTQARKQAVKSIERSRLRKTDSFFLKGRKLRDAQESLSDLQILKSKRLNHLHTTSILLINPNKPGCKQR